MHVFWIPNLQWFRHGSRLHRHGADGVDFELGAPRLELWLHMCVCGMNVDFRCTFLMKEGTTFQSPKLHHRVPPYSVHAICDLTQLCSPVTHILTLIADFT
jgi:hypothetical protein